MLTKIFVFMAIQSLLSRHIKQTTKCMCTTTHYRKRVSIHIAMLHKQNSAAVKDNQI